MAYRVIYDGVMGRGHIQFATEQQLKEFIEGKGGLEELRKLNPEVEIVVPLRLEEVDTVIMGNKRGDFAGKQQEMQKWANRGGRAS